MAALYAIRKRETREYLLARNRTRGGTAEQPLPWPGTPGRCPRMFHSVSAARKALTAWCKGEWFESPGGPSGPDGEWDGPEIRITPGTERDRSSMEIVEFNLTEGEVFS